MSLNRLSITSMQLFPISNGKLDKIDKITSQTCRSGDKYCFHPVEIKFDEKNIKSFINDKSYSFENPDEYAIRTVKKYNCENDIGHSVNDITTWIKERPGKVKEAVDFLSKFEKKLFE